MPIRKIKSPRNFDPCRICRHNFISHTDLDYQLTDRCLNISDERCKCRGFKPKDNLEFLEWEYNGKLDKKFSN
jgi:hypothetical protein